MTADFGTLGLQVTAAPWIVVCFTASSLHGPFARPDHAFDEQADFIVRYATRRKLLEAEPELRVRR